RADSASRGAYGTAGHTGQYPADGRDPPAGGGRGPGAHPGPYPGQGSGRTRGGLRVGRGQCHLPPYRRLQASAAHGLTRFVGGEAEFETLTQALVRAGTGHGQVIAVLGEAGVGKSRLVYEFLRLTARRAGACWRVRRSPMARRPRTSQSLTSLSAMPTWTSTR